MRRFRLIAKYSIIILLILCGTCYISANYALIPSVQRILFISAPLVCLFLGFLMLKKLHGTYRMPVKPKYWVTIVFTGLVTAGVIVFAMLYASVINKAENFLTSLGQKYKYDDITFYTYENDLLIAVSRVRYSENGELISHPVDSISFIDKASEIHIERKDSIFLIYTKKERFLFSPKTKRTSRIRE